MKWIVWANVNLAEAAGRLAAALPSGSEGGVQENSQDWVPADQRGAGAVEKAKADLASCFKILDGGLAGRSFLLGEYSLADAHIQGFGGWIAALGVDRKPYPNVMSWLKRCGERPALAKLMAG